MSEQALLALEDGSTHQDYSFGTDADALLK
jgi:hypothetical protein